ncbi:ketopantoate reductase family protein [Halalkalicoccus jeotgali]|uniref:2-dehydropantoate 2-reductase n=1 Tax=Halalkalicoccus jeotgali (strain DSM 18796 / CECT 7217 / JCM 14584 / KCTC 4019 / B3) TaxID=795797 RepID=D8J4E7_HALJB|nr:2-dehydropantoate 2-reductase [Halalkalicoccus jeotgali]ADJ13509.1 2-dehydropantoate 2-reductase [Halalkalicoccus jeotgali B3]ELY33016.1 2-dehydropantoate 2-reductase [Halalkalicoccus jeotgali B3]
MRIVLFGAGSLGSLLGGLLAREHDVVLVGRDPHVAAIREDGLRVGGEFDYRIDPEVTTDGTGLTAALALVTVKSYDTDEAARTLSTGEFGTALSLQNGLGNEERLAAELDCPVLAGTASYGARLIEPGAVECTGLGRVVLGPPEGGESTLATMIGEAFAESGLETTVADDMPRRLWVKCAVNTAINPLTALTGTKNGVVLDEPAWPIAREAAHETARVARESGVDLSEEMVVDALERVASATRGNTSSMAQDLRKGRRTEIDAINGYVAQQAEGSVPTNALLTGLVKTWENSHGSG